jgi:acetyl-CoA acyltransferase
MMREAVLVSSVRTAVGKAPKGTLRATRPDDLAALVIREALARAKGVNPADIEDIIIGCATPEAEQGMNLARIASLRAGLPVGVSAMTINRFCSSTGFVHRDCNPSRTPPSELCPGRATSPSRAAPSP